MSELRKTAKAASISQNTTREPEPDPFVHYSSVGITIYDTTGDGEIAISPSQFSDIELPALSMSDLNLSPSKNANNSIVILEQEYNTLKTNLEKLESRLRSSRGSNLSNSELSDVSYEHINTENKILKESENEKQKLVMELSRMNDEKEEKIRQLEYELTVINTSTTLKEVDSAYYSSSSIVRELSNSKAKLSGQLQDVKEENKKIRKTARSEIEKLKKQLQSYESQLREASLTKQSLDATNQMCTSLRKLHEDAQAKIEELSAQLLFSKSQQSDLLNKSMESEGHATALAATSGELEAQVRILEQQVSDIEESKVILSNENKRLHEQMERDFKESLQKLDEQKRLHKEIEESLRATISSDNYQQELNDRRALSLQSKISSYEVEIKHLKEEISSLRSENKLTTSTIHESSDKMRTMSVENVNVKYELNEYREQLERATRELSSLRSEKINMEAEVTRAKDVILTLRKTIENLEDRSVKQNEKVNVLQKRVSEAQLKEDSYDKCTVELQHCQKRIFDLTEEKERVGASLQALEETNNKLRIDLKITLNRLHEIEIDNAAQDSMVVADLDACRAELDRTKQQASVIKQQYDKCASDNLYLKRENQSLTERVSESTIKIRNLSEQQQILLETALTAEAKQEHIEVLRTKLETIQSERDELFKRTREMNSSTRSLLEKVESLESKIQEQNSHSKAVETTMNTLQQQCSDAQQEVEIVKSQSRSLQVQNGLLKQQRDQADAELATERERNDKLLAEVGENRSLFERAKSDLEAYRQQMAAEVMSYNSKLSELGSLIEAGREERTLLRNEKIETEKKLMQMTEQKNEQERNKKQLEKEVKEWRSKYEISQNELASVIEENQKLGLLYVQKRELEQTIEQLTRTKERLEESVNQAENHVHELNVSMAVVQQKLDAAIKNGESLEKKLQYNENRLSKKIEKLETSFKSVSTERDTLARENTKLQDQLNVELLTKNNLLERVEKIERQKRELNDVSIRVNNEQKELYEQKQHDLMAQVEILSKDGDQLREEIEAIRQDRDALANTRREIEQRVRDLSEEANVAKLSSKLSEKRCIDLQIKLETLELKLQESHGTIQNVNQNVRNISIEKEEILQKNRKLERDVNSLKTELASVNGLLEKEKQMQSDKLLGMESRVEQKSMELSVALSDRDRAHLEIVKLEESLSREREKVSAQSKELQKHKQGSIDWEQFVNKSEERIKLLVEERDKLLQEVERSTKEHNKVLEKMQVMRRMESDNEVRLSRTLEENAKMRTMLRHYEMNNETRLKSPIEQTTRTVKSPVGTKSPIRVTIPQPKSTSPTKSPVKACSPTRLIRSPIIDQEVNQMNSRVFEMSNVLDRVGKDLRKIRGVEGDPVSIEQEVEGLSKFYKELNEQLQLSQIQNAKLAETIKNKVSFF
jgi:chromosome segregation ATPase